MSLLEKLLPRKVFKPKFPIVVNSIPKSGTNLLLNIVLAIPNLSRKGDFSRTARYRTSEERLFYIKQSIEQPVKGQVAAGHSPYFKEYDEWLSLNNIKQVFIYRDPRDVTISLYKYIMNKVPKHACFDLMNELPDNNSRLMGAIVGIGLGQKEFAPSDISVPNIRLIYEAYQGCLDNQNTFAVSYESLVQKDTGVKAVMDLLTFLDYHPSDISQHAEQIYDIGKNPEKSHTYRKGVSGAWKKEYTKEHIEKFLDVFPKSLLSMYGYSF